MRQVLGRVGLLLALSSAVMLIILYASRQATPRGRHRDEFDAALPAAGKPEDPVVSTEDRNEATPPPRILVEGRVQDENGEPVGDAQLYVLPPTVYAIQDIHPYCEPTVSGADGSFSLAGSPDATVLVCRKRCYVPAIQHLEARRDSPAQNSVTITLRRGGQFVGSVTDLADGPIDHAVVRARAISVHMDLDPRTAFAGVECLHVADAETDAEGRFVVRGVDERTSFVVEAQATGWAMERPSWRTPVRPADVPVTIRMVPVVAAVLGFRTGGEDCSRYFAGTLSLASKSCVRLPKGYRLAHSPPLGDRFAPEIVAASREIADRFFLVIAAADSAASAGDGPLDGAVTVDGDVHSVHYSRIGESGWDKPQWIEVPGGAGPSAAVTVVLSSSRGAEDIAVYLLAKERGRGGQRGFLFLERDGTRYAGRVPPGEYVVRQVGFDDNLAEFSVASAEQKELTIDVPRRSYLRVCPLYKSGAAAREIGITILREGSHDIVRRILEPFGASAGSEAIPITAALQGVATVYVGKAGFEPVALKVEIAADDLVLRPVLVPAGER